MDRMIDETTGSSVRRYSSIAIAIHWLSAVLIIAQIILGLKFGDMPKGPARLELFTWHKTVGVVILLLAFARLAVRLTNKPPAFPEGFPKWERAAAVWNNRIFYFLMIALPLTGLSLVGEHSPNGMTGLIGGISVPVLPYLKVAESHTLLAWGMIGLLVLHVAAALKQQFFDKSVVADRMPPFHSPRG
jgi:cytochrome b561